MIPYLQTEFLNAADTAPAIILAGAPIPFDHHLNVSSAIEYDNATHQFKIKMAGAWLVNWFTAQQSGLSHEGSNFGCAIYKPITDDTDPDYGQLLPPDVVVGSGHVKISPTSGFTIINVSEADILSPIGGVVFELQNVSSHDAALSERTQVKAGLAVFGVSADMFKMAYGQWQAAGWDKIAAPYNLADEEKIKFNQPLLVPLGIVANSDYDVFTLETAGVYQVSWEIPIEATYSVEAVEIVLQLNGATVYARSYSPLPIGVVSGTAIVAVSNANTTLSIVNLQPNGGDIIQIGNYANLAIHQISTSTGASVLGQANEQIQNAEPEDEGEG